MSLNMIKWLGVGIASSMVAYANLPAALLPVQRASLAALAAAELRPVPTNGTEAGVRAAKIWEERGAVVMAVRRPG